MMGPLSAIKMATAGAKESEEGDIEAGEATGYAQDIIDAIGDGDSGALSEALKMHYAACAAEDGAAADEDETEDEDETDEDDDPYD
jgi:hypothetical protein